jgi:hypothetical protein
MGEGVIGHDIKPIQSHDIMVFLVEVKTGVGQIFELLIPVDSGFFFTTISKLENRRFQVFEKKKPEFEMG